MKNTTDKKLFDYILSAAFVAIIALPFAGFLLGFNTGADLGEKRQLMQKPSLDNIAIQKYPEEYEAYFQDHFGFRNDLVFAHNWLKYKLFKSGSVGRVIVGKENWLFLTKADIISDYLGLLECSPEKVQQWADALQSRKKWLNDRGIKYLFVIAPNKISIYPEMLPDHIRDRKGTTQMDQIVDYLQKNTNIDFIDFREPLIKAKSQGLVYHPRDSHWNGRGAFVVYQSIAKYLKQKWYPEIEPMTLDQFIITTEKRTDDLATMIGLGDELAQETVVLVPKKMPNASSFNLLLPQNYPWPSHMLAQPQTMFNNEKASPRLLLFHDSFGPAGNLTNYIAEHFRSTVCLPLRSDQKCLEIMVQQENPDIVIEQMVERKFIKPPAVILFDE